MQIQTGSATFGQILKALRKEKCLEQEQVVEHLTISINYLSLLENDHRKCSLDVMRQFARVYQLPFEKLLFLIGIRRLPHELSKNEIDIFEQSVQVLNLVFTQLSLR